MIAEVKERIFHLQEEAMMTQLSRGKRSLLRIPSCMSSVTPKVEGSSKKKLKDEFQLPEKRKKPIAVSDILFNAHHENLIVPAVSLPAHGCEASQLSTLINLPYSHSSRDH